MSAQDSHRQPDLSNFFKPRNVALVGASERSGWSIGIAARFKEYGFEGEIYAVNKTGAAAHGYPGFTSCRDIGKPVDMAYIFIPVEAVMDGLADAAAAGIKNAVILTSGFSETGAEGAALQARLLAFAEENGMTLFGPNSLGFANVRTRQVTTIVPARLPLLDGGIALISQSGAVGGEIAKVAHQQGVGLNFIAATGNEAQVGIEHIIDYLVDDVGTKVITVFVESIRRPAAFRQAAARALAARKPLVVLKVGKSEITAQIAKAHTGSLVGDDAIFDAVCRQCGVIRVNCLEEMLATAALFEQVGVMEKSGVGVVSISGGACGMFADLSEASGVSLPAFSEQTQAALREVLPDYASSLNPLDITGAVTRDPELWARVIPIVDRDSSVGVTAVIHMLPGIERELMPLRAHGKAIHDGLAQTGGPGFFMAAAMQPVNEVLTAFKTETGVAINPFGIDYTVRALGHISRWSEHTRQPVSAINTSTATSGKRPHSEREVLDYLAAASVPVIPAIVAKTMDAAVTHTRELNEPVALKIASPDIAHKTEIGGVKLNVQGDAAVAEAYAAISENVKTRAPQARIDGIIVSPMRSGGIELFIGTARDPQWGPLITVGLGGVWVEVLKDSATRLLPVARNDVLEMLQELRGVKLLQGFRGNAPVDLNGFADVVVKVGNAALALGPELAALEINPLLARGDQLEALDGVAIWNDED